VGTSLSATTHEAKTIMDTHPNKTSTIPTATIVASDTSRSSLTSSPSACRNVHATTFTLEVPQDSALAWDIEERLRHYYLTTVARWLDTSDPLRHFAIVVPALATSCHALTLAMLAVAATHMEASGNVDQDEFVTVGERYRQACVRALEPCLSDYEGLEPPVLASVVLLRMAVQTSSS